jgi:hypothetical protein
MTRMIEMRDTSLAGVSHKWSPASDECRAYGTLRFGTSVRGVTVYLDTPAEVDEVIAELVALKQEMAPPVITDAEARCLKPARHGPHLAGAVVDCSIAAHHEAAEVSA